MGMEAVLHGIPAHVLIPHNTQVNGANIHCVMARSARILRFAVDMVHALRIMDAHAAQTIMETTASNGSAMESFGMRLRLYVQDMVRALHQRHVHAKPISPPHTVMFQCVLLLLPRILRSAAGMVCVVVSIIAHALTLSVATLASIVNALELNTTAYQLAQDMGLVLMQTSVRVLLDTQQKIVSSVFVVLSSQMTLRMCVQAMVRAIALRIARAVKAMEVNIANSAIASAY